MANSQSSTPQTEDWDEASEAVMQWERAFRARFAEDEGMRFKDLIERFQLSVDAGAMLELTVDMVTACVGFGGLDGRPATDFLDLQRYDVLPMESVYAYTFDMCGRGAARIVAKPDTPLLDLADMFDFPWDRLRAVGFSRFWISRTDGKGLSPDELLKLEASVIGDLRFDYGEEELSVDFDAESFDGDLVVYVTEVFDEEVS